MSTPFRGSSTSTSQIQIDWATSTDNGGGTIDSYHLQMYDTGTSAWIDL